MILATGLPLGSEIHENRGNIRASLARSQLFWDAEGARLLSCDRSRLLPPRETFVIPGQARERGDDAAKIALSRPRQLPQGPREQTKGRYYKTSNGEKHLAKERSRVGATVAVATLREMMGDGEESATGQALEARSDDEGMGRRRKG